MSKSINSAETIQEEEIELLISEQDHEQFRRLDHLLGHYVKDYSRSFIKILFKKGLISGVDSNGTEFKVELKKPPLVGSKIFIQIPPPLPSEAKAQNIPLDILYEDEHLLFVNKEAGMVTHPAPGNWDGTLVNAVIFHCPDLLGIGNQLRPGIVHRLDKGTSGVMIVAKTQLAHEKLVLTFSTHDLKRKYLAICLGNKIPLEGTIETLFGRHPSNRLKMSSKVSKGKKAITHYRAISYIGPLTLLELTLETGRTHQIRVHLSECLNSPILGDPLYANREKQFKEIHGEISKILKDYPYPLLHAKKLMLNHPVSGQLLDYEVNPPDIFQEVLEIASKHYTTTTPDR